MAFEYANTLISAKAEMIGPSSPPSARGLHAEFRHVYNLFVPTHTVFKCIFYELFNLHRGARCSPLDADTHFSLLSPSVGLALTSGTTRIPATRTRMWWKTILRCSIVSGLELGLSCSKVVASACGCCRSVELELSVSHCL